MSLKLCITESMLPEHGTDQRAVLVQNCTTLGQNRVNLVVALAVVNLATSYHDKMFGTVPNTNKKIEEILDLATTLMYDINECIHVSINKTNPQLLRSLIERLNPVPVTCNDLTVMKAAILSVGISVDESKVIDDFCFTESAIYKILIDSYSLGDRLTLTGDEAGYTSLVKIIK